MLLVTSWRHSILGAKWRCKIVRSQFLPLETDLYPKFARLGKCFLTLETGISANFDVRRMLSHPGGCDKPIPEVVPLWRHRTSTPNNLEKSRLVCVLDIFCSFLDKNEKNNQTPHWGRDDKPRRGLQIMDTRMGFPCPFHSVVIDSINPLPSLSFSGRLEKQDGRHCLWFVETFSTSPPKLLNGIQRNLTGSKISTPSTKFVFFGPIGKTRRPPWSLIAWGIFDFSSETAEQKSTKLDREQDLNVLYQVCVFRADQKNKMAALDSDWLRHFRLFLWNRWTEFNETWQEARSQRPLPSLSPKWPPWPLIGWDIFNFYSETALRNSKKLDRKLDLNVLYQVFGPIRKTRWLSWPLICGDIFDFYSETAEWISAQLDRKQDLNILYQVCLFLADQ